MCNSNPLSNWQTEYNRKLKTILKDVPDLVKKFFSFMPSLPYLYGLPKIHKLNNPLRPIVCTASSVTYKLSKFLASILKQLNGKISSSYVLNTEDFVSKIRNIDLNGKVMVSFDVKSLFTNVPINDTLNFLEEYLETNPIDMPFSLNVLIKLIRLCVVNCFFSCNNNLYR